jgi:UPF0755 protein
MKRRLLLLAAASALAVMAGLIGDLWTLYRGFAGDLIVVIQPGTRAPDVAQLLNSSGVLAHHWPFVFLCEFGRLRHLSVKAGEYLFDRALRPIDVYRKLTRGDVYLHAVLIPEGSDRLDMARILQQQLGLSPEDFLRATEQAALIRDLDPGALSLEGYLYPDTYRFPRTVSSTAVVSAMLARFRKVIESQLPPELAQSPERLQETITLASLLEKETPDPVERPVIAGVFARRLEKKMPLQCDPTVVYADRLARHPITKAAGPITRGELAAESPYNTYLHAGLPPGPICSPGLLSIRAALNPAAGSALYFVSNNRGGHVFASTLEEHERNVTRYRRELAALRRPPRRATESNGEVDQLVPASHDRTKRSKRKRHVGTKARSADPAFGSAVRTPSGQKQKTAHP